MNLVEIETDNSVTCAGKASAQKSSNEKHPSDKHSSGLAALVPDAFSARGDSSAGTEQSDEEFVLASSEMFQDPGAFDYISKRAPDTESDLYKQSLYVKFDPLLQKTSASEAIDNVDFAKPDTSRCRTNAESASFPEVSVELANASLNVSSADSDSADLFATPPTVMKRQLSAASGSVGLASSEVDKLLASSPQQSNNCPSPDAVTAVRLQYQAELLAKERDLVAKCNAGTQQLDTVLRENGVLRQQVLDLSRLMANLEKVIRRSIVAGAGYRTLSEDSLVLQIERDQAIQDLLGVELSFSDLHRRYEKLKSVTDDNKKNETSLRSQLSEHQEKLRKSEDRFKRLKENAEAQVERANEEVERLNRKCETDTLGLKAQLKKTDIKIDSLEKQLAQKTIEVKELTEICDELIAKHSK